MKSQRRVFGKFHGPDLGRAHRVPGGGGGSEVGGRVTESAVEKSHSGVTQHRPI